MRYRVLPDEMTPASLVLATLLLLDAAAGRVCSCSSKFVVPCVSAMVASVRKEVGGSYDPDDSTSTEPSTEPSSPHSADVCSSSNSSSSSSSSSKEGYVRDMLREWVKARDGCQEWATHTYTHSHVELCTQHIKPLNHTAAHSVFGVTYECECVHSETSAGKTEAGAAVKKGKETTGTRNSGSGSGFRCAYVQH